MPTLPVAFTYLCVAFLVSSLTKMRPSPQGTTTLTGPKHTVTFITFVALKSQSQTFELAMIFFFSHMIVASVSDTEQSVRDCVYTRLERRLTECGPRSEWRAAKEAPLSVYRANCAHLAVTWERSDYRGKTGRAERTALVAHSNFIIILAYLIK